MYNTVMGNQTTRENKQRSNPPYYFLFSDLSDFLIFFAGRGGEASFGAAATDCSSESESSASSSEGFPLAAWPSSSDDSDTSSEAESVESAFGAAYKHNKSQMVDETRQ